jgi:diguanylate cyclase (GGDEF)-like protein
MTAASPVRAVRLERLVGTPLGRRLAVVDTLAAVGVLWAAVAVATNAAPSPWRLALAVGVVAPAMLFELPLRVGNRRLRIAGLFEAALILGLAALSGPWLVLIVAAVAVLREHWLRRPLDKLLFNTAAHAGPVAVAAFLLGAVDPALSDPVVTAGAWICAAALFHVLNLVAVIWVVAAANEEPVLPLLRDDVPTSLLGLGVNAALAVGVLAAVAGRRWELALAAPFVVVAIVRNYRRRLADETTQDALPRLRLAARAIGALDERQAFAEVLDRAAALFGIERVELVLRDWPGVGDQTHTRAGPDRVTSTPSCSAPEPGLHQTSVDLLAGAGGSLTRLGELRLTFPAPLSLTAAERDVLDTFAGTTSAALSHTRSYAEQFNTARVDPLTGLPNRLALREQVEMLLPTVLDARAGAAPGQPAPGLAVLLFDLDHFKEVNDTLGHSVGDDLLIAISTRMAHSLRPEDMLVRLGGDEFAVLLQGVASGREAMLVAEKLLARLNEPVPLEGLELPVEASAGVALAPRDGTTLEQLLRCADVAMYRAKAKRNAAVVYDPQLDLVDEERLHLVSELQTAIRDEQLIVHYQPLVSLRTGRTVGAEALVRWQHPVHGLLPPGKFIPAVERTALIVPMTMAVLDQAVHEAASWPTVDGHELSLNVNLSPRCLLARGLPEQVLRILARHGLPARRLTLEITETLVMSDLEVVDEVLCQLRAIGVRLSVDDFGTGYSSMSFLRKIAVNEVKVDRSFVAEAPRSRGDRAIVDATIELAHGLGLSVVGEGVETRTQLRTLLDSGCDTAQGFLLGRPQPADELRPTLTSVSAAVLDAMTTSSGHARRAERAGTASTPAQRTPLTGG